MTEFNKKQAVLAALTLVLTLGLVGCEKKPATNTNQNENVNANQNQNINQNNTKNNSEWITFSGNLYGFIFELKYPREWGESWEGKISIPNFGDKICFKSKFYLNAENNDVSTSTADILCIAMMNKKQWDESGSQNNLGEFLVENNGYVFYSPIQKMMGNFILTPQPTAEKIKEILSTFKFLDPGFSITDSNAPISIILGEDGWKTYTNKYWNVRFKFEDKDNKILLYNVSGKNDMDIEFYKPGETTSEDMYINIYKGNFPSEYINNLKKYISEGNGWDTAQNDIRLISLEKLNYPNINEIYKVIVESMAVQRVNPKIVRGGRIFMVNQNNSNEYISIYNYNNPIIKQILSSWEFLKD